MIAREDKPQTALAEALAMRARAAGDPSPLPALGVHLILGTDFGAMMRNSLRNLQEQRTGLINLVPKRTD